MKYQCGMIRDLLPLYHDNVCSLEYPSASSKKPPHSRR